MPKIIKIQQRLFELQREMSGVFVRDSVYTPWAIKDEVKLIFAYNCIRSRRILTLSFTIRLRNERHSYDIDLIHVTDLFLLHYVVKTETPKM